MNLENGTWVAVCDGGKFLLLQNNGDSDLMDLRVVAHEEIDASTQAGRTDRGPSPDGFSARIGKAHSNTVDDLAEHRFVQGVSAELTERVDQGLIDKLVLIADPKTLGMLRKHLSDTVQASIQKEIGGDYAHSTVADVETLIKRA